MRLGGGAVGPGVTGSSRADVAVAGAVAGRPGRWMRLVGGVVAAAGLVLAVAAVVSGVVLPVLGALLVGAVLAGVGPPGRRWRRFLSVAGTAMVVWFGCTLGFGVVMAALEGSPDVAAAPVPDGVTVISGPVAGSGDGVRATTVRFAGAGSGTEAVVGYYRDALPAAQGWGSTSDRGSSGDRVWCWTRPGTHSGQEAVVLIGSPQGFEVVRAKFDTDLGLTPVTSAGQCRALRDAAVAPAVEPG